MCIRDSIGSAIKKQESRFRNPRNSAKIACFTESVQSKYMWDRYADGLSLIHISCADGESDDGWYQDSLARLFCYLQRLVDVIVANPDGFNDYVAHNLPCQQRIGRIARKELNRIAPSFKINVEDRETAIKALEDSAKEHSALHLTVSYTHLFPT